jgi:hypothetical protein
MQLASLPYHQSRAGQPMARIEIERPWFASLVSPARCDLRGDSASLSIAEPAPPFSIVL